MRIALLYLDKGGGIGHCSLELAKVISRHTDVICYITTSNTLLDKFLSLPCEVKIFDLQRGWKSLLRSMVTQRGTSGIAEAVVADAPDIVLDTGSILWMQVIERQLGGRFPVAEVLHDVNPHPGLRSPLYNLYAKFYPSLADAIITMSEYSYKKAMQKYPHKKHIQSYHGVILGDHHIDPKAIASRRNKLLFFGQITPYKGLDDLVVAYEIAKKSNPELSLSIVGKGKITTNLKKRIVQLGIELKNEYVADSTAKEIIGDHGIMILPYTSATQSGIAATALANGLPAIATNVGALPEQIISGRNGIIVPPKQPNALANAIIRVSQNATLAQSMSEQSLIVAKQKYSWDRIGCQLLSDLEVFLQEKTRSYT